ncbi:MAG: hypothetical protein RJR37_09595 [Peptococcaceae bacterium MAG4]|nr:hypothetical protein [Peptococcaceae bacterium MAG4]
MVKGKNQVVINDDHYLRSKNETKAQTSLQAEFEALAPVAEEYLQHLSQRREGHLREQMQKIISLKKSTVLLKSMQPWNEPLSLELLVTQS